MPRHLFVAFLFVLVACSQALPQTASAQADERAELLANGSFGGDLAPWWTTATVAAEVGESGACLDILDAGANPWDAILGQHEIPVVAGGAYTLSFKARAEDALTVKVILQENGGDYTPYFATDVALSPETEYSYEFTADATDPAATFQFQLGGSAETMVCLDDVSLLGRASEPVTETKPNIRINQHAYLPNAVKRASVVSDALEPIAWTLKSVGGDELLSGMTTVFGLDASSQNTLHHADFSSLTQAGEYVLEVAGETSHPFEVRADAYKTLKYDALRYFYHNRSGIEIETQYTGGGGGSYAPDAQWARPAGHLSEGVNKGDYDVPCWPEAEGAPRGCNYTLDVTKGWYDAGDHGKYVVNSGISTWTLMNLFERSRAVGDRSFGDGTLNIPESGNGVPDLLDEIRWNLEFMLAMQVPQGQELAGMVHHKVHDFNWTGLGLAPHRDPQTRYLVPPSVTATLNLAASAAQCARIWKPIDPKFSAECIKAARRAWKAAEAHPELYYGDCCNSGGGPYSDRDATDEFYWATAELFITTGKKEYGRYLAGSDDYLELPVSPDDPSSMFWGSTSALGNISLLSAPNKLGKAPLATLKKSVLETADRYVQLSQDEGYGLPFTVDGEGEFPWGSNASVLNNGVVLGVAYDLSGNDTYLQTVSQGADYLLGRNAVDQSYVTGYGERPLMNPHHRFWAFGTNNSFPLAPPGAVSGGPNSGLEDPVASARLRGCAAQKCFIDDIDSWSTNEITINWNAPLVWVTAFLDSEK